jgi:hypothetical protein
MFEKPERFGDLLLRIHEYEHSPDGHHGVFVSRLDDSGDDSFSLDTPAMVLLIYTDDPDDFVHPLAAQFNLIEVAAVSDVQNIIDVAFEDKPDCSLEDLVKCIHYYLDHDAFYQFDDG